MELPAGRFVVPMAVGGALLVVAIAGVAYLLLRDDDVVARGDLIAYSCKEQKNDWFAICVMRSDGTEKRRMTSQLATTDPAWSADGRRIAFTRNEDVGEFTTFTDDDVFVMDADGGDLEQLTPERDGSTSGQPAWSPDGREIVFVRGPSVASAVSAATATRFGSLLVMRPDGSVVRRLTRGEPDAAPAWSPDGREIAFVRGHDLNRQSGDADLFVMDAAGGEPRRLTNSPAAFETAPAWSPDGSRIAFARGVDQSPYDGKAAIFVVNRDGTGERLVLEHQLYSYTSYGLSWSPDGRTLAFETSPNRLCSAVALVPVDGGPVRRLTSCKRPSQGALAPAWQPAESAEEP
jgi:Tol biopolymer transport system component